MFLSRKLFQLAAALAALFLMGIAILIVAQVASRMTGHQIPSSDELAAWSMAASAFLALPATLMGEEHIRVSILTNLVAERWRHRIDMLATLFAIGIMGWAGWHTANFVWQSYLYHDVSEGILRVPLWIPQLAMALGIVLMVLAFIERLVLLATGRLENPRSTSPNLVE